MSAQQVPRRRADGFAAVICAARLVAGLDQSKVASGVGVEQSTVSEWECGRAVPTVPLFGGLVAVLGPWPLLEALLPPGEAGMDAAARLPGPRRQTLGGEVAVTIRASRQAAGLTQAQLGVRVGVQQSAVGQWERGRTLPTLLMLRGLVGVLGPWPLLEALLPSDRAGLDDTVVAATLAPRPRTGRPSRQELARLVV